jgi:hypothetical protein
MSDTDAKHSTVSDPIVREGLEAFDMCVEREAHNREDALDDIQFARLAEQWYETDRKNRELEGRPCLTINRLPSFIRQVVNDARQNTPSISVHPVDDKADPKTATVLGGLLRNIEGQSDADVAYDTALESAVTCGIGYFRINTYYSHDDTFEQDICIKRVPNAFSIYADPYSTHHDSSDWNTAFVVDRMSKTAFEKKYKGADAVDWKSDTYSNMDSAWREGDEVQIAEFWKRSEVMREISMLSNGSIIDMAVFKANADKFQAIGLVPEGQTRKVKSHEVKQYIMNGVEVLEKIDWKGKYIPIVPVYGEDVIVDGKRHLRSMVRDAKDPQRMFNYWRTAATELVALAPKAPWIGPAGAFATDAQKWATANTDSHAFIEFDGPSAPQRQPFAGVPAGALQEALNAADDMKSIMGLHDASLGARSNETSGKAILARQREGDVSSFHFIDNLSRSIRHAGRIIIDLIPHVYSTERVIRTLGLDGQPETVPVNQPVIARDKQPAQPMPEGMTPEQLPEDMQGLVHIFDLTTGKYDVTVKAGPSFTTQREEAASQMMEMMRVFPQAAPYIGDLLAKNLDWPGAEEIAERLKAVVAQATGQPVEGGEGGGQQAQAQQQVQAVTQQAQAQMQQMMQAMQGLQQQIEQLKADRSIEAQENEIKGYEAETRRMVAENNARKIPQYPA